MKSEGVGGVVGDNGVENVTLGVYKEGYRCRSAAKEGLAS